MLDLSCTPDLADLGDQAPERVPGDDFVVIRSSPTASRIRLRSSFITRKILFPKGAAPTAARELASRAGL
jgi:hypothetical protein